MIYVFSPTTIEVGIEYPDSYQGIKKNILNICNSLFKKNTYFKPDRFAYISDGIGTANGQKQNF